MAVVSGRLRFRARFAKFAWVSPMEWRRIRMLDGGKAEEEGGTIVQVIEEGKVEDVGGVPGIVAVLMP